MCEFVPVNMAKHAVAMMNWLEDLHLWAVERFVSIAILPAEVDSRFKVKTSCLF